MSSYTIVDATMDDNPPESFVNLIYSKWLRTLRRGNDFFKLIDAESYYEAYQSYIEKILSNKSCRIRYAVLSNDPDVILGFCVYRGNILDYIYVDRLSRKIGIASHLVPVGIDTITHLTRTGLSIWGSKCKGWKFNPFA